MKAVVIDEAHFIIQHSFFISQSKNSNFLGRPEPLVFV